ncbi:hypothetical protein GIB67_020180 [Kingdonia uniflora]|uniref:Uncharacterized protein n=1 Tax=Kingdonia uniflora TaxID=39325 RepID=A0A7J7NUN3_9MAGN|nr:hypothetical protein GIB67_020180 [Kingdonia uniflora]
MLLFMDLQLLLLPLISIPKSVLPFQLMIQGLRHLFSATLARAGDFVLKQLVHTLPLRDMHLSALLTAAVETDLNDLGRTKIDSLSVYLKNLMLKNKPMDLQSPHNFLDIKMK